MSTENKNTRPASLDFKVFAEIAGALARLKELSKSALSSPTADAEIKGLNEYLVRSFLQYGEEFLGCWITIRREYEPALKALASVAHRVRGILGAEVRNEVVQENDMSVDDQLAAAAAASEPVEEPNKILQLPK